MADDTNIQIKLTAKDEASGTLRDAISALNDSMKSLNDTQRQQLENQKDKSDKDKDEADGIFKLAAVTTLLNQGLELASKAWEAISHQMEKAIDEALQAEKAQTLLTGALVGTGQYSKEASTAVEEYAKNLQKLTGFSDDVAKANVAMGIQMGLSTERAMAMNDAAVKLAAATGKDLGEAFHIMQSSMAGNTRELAKILPEVKDFSAATLKSGAAIDLINTKLKAQLDIYSSSFPAALNKVKSNYSDIYENLGKIITQSPAIQAATNALADAFSRVAQLIDDNKADLIAFVNAGVLLAAEAIPILIKAFELLDLVIVNTMNSVRLIMIAAGEAANAFLMLGSIIPNSVMQKFGFDIDAARSTVEAFTASLGDNITESQRGLDSRKAGLEKINTVVDGYVDNIQKAANAEGQYSAKSIADSDERLKRASEENAALLRKHQLYTDIDIETSKIRDKEKGDVAARDKENKDFEEYLKNKTRLAIDAEEERTMKVNEIRAKALEGSGGSTGSQAKADLEINAEVQKQAELKTLRAKQVIDDQQYEAARLANEQAFEKTELEQSLANKQARADLLGESDAGYALKAEIENERFQLELQQKMERAQLEMATDEEIFQIKQDAEMVHQQQQRDALDAHLAAVAAKEEVNGATVTATRQKWFREQEKAQAQAIKNFASGVMLMTSIQAAYNTTTQALGDALIKNEKITASKFVGIFLEQLGRKIQMDGFANLLMGAAMSIMLNPQGPALIAAGGAEIAGGTAIGRLGLSMQGGQAHEGLTEVGSSMDNKSFVLAQGERVVASNQNSDLKDFLSREKNGEAGSGGGSVYNITLNYGGTGNQEDASKMADIIIQQIRAKSERGVTIMSERGISRS